VIDDQNGEDPVKDPQLQEVAHLVRQVLLEDRMRPAVRDELRARLVAAAAVGAPRRPMDEGDVVRSREPGRSMPATGTQPARSRDRRPRGTRAGTAAVRPEAGTGAVRPAVGGRRTRPGRVRGRRRRSATGWSVLGAAAGLGAVLVLLRSFAAGPETAPTASPAAVQAITNVVDVISASPSQGVSLSFSRPLDRNSVVSALRLQPATSVSTTWQGDTLTLSSAHGFAANTAYVLTVDHRTARTTDGAPLASDIRVTFGTAPTVRPASNAATPAPLTRTVLAAAADGSEAVPVRDGSILLTAASTGAGSGDRLVRMSGTTTGQLAPATPAICVSRSGRSVAYLSGVGAGARVVLADGSGTTQTQVPVIADQGTPLGWIGDTEVTFVSGGRLRAIDRTGHLRTVFDGAVDAAKDTVVIAPGGRYVYLARAGKAGQVGDLATGKWHPLPGVVGAPAFSADGATVMWVHSSARTSSLDSAPSGGGPTLSVVLPGVLPGDVVSDLSVSPDGSLLVYSVTHAAAAGAELRLASLPSLATVAMSSVGAGESPNWAPSGQMFTVLGHGSGGPQIQAVDVSAKIVGAVGGTAAASAVAQAFVNAQIGGDGGAQQAIAPGVRLPSLPVRVTRADVIQVLVTGAGTVTATARLSADPTATEGVRQGTETLHLTVSGGSSAGVPVVTGVELGTFRPAPAGPQLTQVDTVSVPGSALLTFDSDLDPRSVPSAIALIGPDGADTAVTASYDVTSRQILVRPAVPGSLAAGTSTIVVTTALRDVAGDAAPTRIQLPVRLAGAGQ
jgi:Bacterial Ig-like domain